LIRFSNGSVEDDRSADAHGMAIKLLKVPGRKLLPGHENETAQDFVLVDSETFFTGDLREYLFFSRGFLAARRSFVSAVFFWTRMLLFHMDLLKKVRSFTSHKPVSPLASRYFSSVPYRLGGRVVKYIARPHMPCLPRARVAAENGLSRALVDQLMISDAVFDFGVEVQIDPVSQPIENPSLQWSSHASARREWLATITIPSQHVDPMSALAEDLSYSPWHALEEHEPLGEINRARMYVYRDMARLRHELNGVVPAGTSEVPLSSRGCDHRALAAPQP
jgi:hypothetical protein